MVTKAGFTEKEAVAELRVVFADLYNELKARGHEVIVAYDDPGNPKYIPQILELDGCDRQRLNIRFFTEQRFSGTKNAWTTCYHWGVLYLPTNTARVAFEERKRERSPLTSKNQLNGPALADWVEKRLDVEKRALRVEEEARCLRELVARSETT